MTQSEVKVSSSSQKQQSETATVCGSVGNPSAMELTSSSLSQVISSSLPSTSNSATRGASNSSIVTSLNKILNSVPPVFLVEFVRSESHLKEGNQSFQEEEEEPDNHDCRLGHEINDDAQESTVLFEQGSNVKES